MIAATAVGDPERGPIVSVIIPHAGGVVLLDRCLRSLTPPMLGEMEVIVVDSGPAEGVHTICDRAPLSLQIVRADRHLGFAAAVNAGFDAARGRYLLVLNNDVAAAPGFVETLVTTAEATGASLVVPRVLSMARPDHIDNTGNELFGDGLNLCRARGRSDDPGRRVPIDPLLPSGAAMLVRRSLLTRIGGFDPAYYAYGEDAEMGMRSLRAGFSCRYAPDAVVYHLGGGTWGASSLRKAYLVERNRARLALTHFPLRRLPAVPLLTTLRYLQHAADGLRGRGPVSAYSGVTRSGAMAAAALALVVSMLCAPADLRRRRSANSVTSLSQRALGDLVRRRTVGLEGVRRRRSW